MNTSKLADIAEITSSIAILVTLVFLVVQMQQNTEAIQASSRQAILSEDVQLLNRLSDNTNLVFNRSKPQLSDEEKVQLHYYYITFFRMWEHQWLQYQNGVLDNVTWENYRNAIGTQLSYDRSRTWWERGAEVQFDLKFVAYVNNYIADIPITNQIAALAYID
jgi:hypothetical protein